MSDTVPKASEDDKAAWDHVVCPDSPLQRPSLAASPCPSPRPDDDERHREDPSTLPTAVVPAVDCSFPRVPTPRAGAASGDDDSELTRAGVADASFLEAVFAEVERARRDVEALNVRAEE